MSRTSGIVQKSVRGDDFSLNWTDSFLVKTTIRFLSLDSQQPNSVVVKGNPESHSWFCFGIGVLTGGQIQAYWLVKLSNWRTLKSHNPLSEFLPSVCWCTDVIAILRNFVEWFVICFAPVIQKVMSQNCLTRHKYWVSFIFQPRFCLKRLVDFFRINVLSKNFYSF